LVKATLRERLSKALKKRKKEKEMKYRKIEKAEDLNMYQQKINEKLEDTEGIQDV
jgi:hypothetical protein